MGEKNAIAAIRDALIGDALSGEEANDRWGDLRIAGAHLAVCLMVALVYAAAPAPLDRPLLTFDAVWLAIGFFGVIALLRAAIARRRSLRPHEANIFAMLVFAVVYALVWSFHDRYGQAAPAVLKSPTLAFVFVFLTLEGLRFDMRHVLVAGAAALAGWAGLAGAAFYEAGPDAVTRDYTAYLNGPFILVGAVAEKAMAIALITGGVAIGVHRGRFLIDGQRRLTERLLEEAKAREQANEALHREAYFDNLTNLPNQRSFRRFVAAEAKAFAKGLNKGFSVLRLDLDRFRLFNDGFGREAGDAAIAGAARILLREAPDGACVARVGADEFAVLLRGVGDGAAALKVAEGLLARFAQPFAAGEREFGAGASIGVAAAIKGDAGACVNAYADIALNQAKKSGSHRVILHAPETRTHAAARLDLEAAMRAAISNGELELNYQPIVRLSDGGLSGWEALARWRRAGGDVVSPAEFIPIAEETGFITELGVWALTQAAEDASNFGAMGAPADAFISVNLSPRQLLHSEALEGALASAIRLYPNIKLEVTETAIVDNPERALVTLQRLRATGARLALDDFGTGASSLAMLNRYPFSTLKIDRAFVEDQGAHAANVLRCIVGLARALGLETVAEGVEDEEGRAMLALIGATYGQGYFFGRPEPADKVIKRLTSATPVASSLALSAG